MAAFGATAVTSTELRGKTASKVNAPVNVYQRVFSFVIPASSTVAGPIDLVGAALPPGTVVLSCVLSPSATLGTTVLALQTKTATAVIAAAATLTAERAATVTTPLAVPTTATANDIIQATTTTATSPASDITVTVTLTCAAIGKEVGRAAAVGN